ncbi:MAG: hypothetical protein QOD42_2658 [Sphingomonadales bacterium]|nr:hypothetical protein [Sphingomonadales bacterium]
MTEVEGKPDSPGDLPFGQGLSFATLDDYLAHLQRRGATGVPWFREVSPGVYALVTGRGRRAPAERATRAELLARFGFDS